jgi:hypothetical protein
MSRIGLFLFPDCYRDETLETLVERGFTGSSEDQEGILLIF